MLTTRKRSRSKKPYAVGKVPCTASAKPSSWRSRDSLNLIIGEPFIGHVAVELNGVELPCTDPGNVDLVQHFNKNSRLNGKYYLYF